jgi:hypothetical protein
MTMCKKLSTSSFAVILLAAVVPCLAQDGQGQTSQVAAPISELALSYSVEPPLNLRDSGREKGLDIVLPGARTATVPAADRRWDELTDGEKEHFGSQLKAEASHRSQFGSGDRAAGGGRNDGASGKSVVFVYRARQPYGR